MSARAKPLHQEVVRFVLHHLGKGCFAPHTGTDWPAWTAFVYLVECYAHGGGQRAIAAMRETVRCAQPHDDVLRTFVQAIPALMDWGDVAQIWPQVADGIISVIGVRGDRGVHVVEAYDARLITAVERSGVGRNGLGGTCRLHGWRPPQTEARP